MQTNELSQRPKIGILYWMTLAVVTPFALQITKPWTWDLPLYSRIAGCVGLPFLFSIPVYLVIYLVYSTLFSKRVAKNEILALLVVFAYLGLGALLLTLVEDLQNYQEIGMGILGTSALVLFEIVSRTGSKGKN